MNVPKEDIGGNLDPKLRPHFHPDFPDDPLREIDANERLRGRIMVMTIPPRESVRILEVITDGTRPLMVRVERINGTEFTYPLIRMGLAAEQQAKEFLSGYSKVV